MSKKPARGDAWFPFYVNDYLGDTMHLTTEQHGAYVLLLLACFKQGGAIPADEASLAAIAKMALPTWRKHAMVLLPYFIRCGDKLVQKRMKEEIDRAAAIIEKRRQNGYLGGRPKNQMVSVSFDLASEKGPIAKANGKQTETHARCELSNGRDNHYPIQEGAIDSNLSEDSSEAQVIPLRGVRP